MRRWTILATSLLLAMAPAFAGAPELDRSRDASQVLDEIMRIPEDGIPQAMFDHAQAIAVIPHVVRAGFVVAGRRGRGLIAVRSADGTWSNPTFITLTGASIGFQVGVQSADVVLIFNTRRGVDSIVNGKFTLGADASVAAGPVGRAGEVATDGNLRAEIYSYSRARGLFAGIALNGAVIAIDDHSNEAVYGPDTTPRMIFEGRVAAPPVQVVDFRDKLEETNAVSDRRDEQSTERVYDPPVAGDFDAPANAAPQREAPAPEDERRQPQPAQTAPLDEH